MVALANPKAIDDQMQTSEVNCSFFFVFFFLSIIFLFIYNHRHYNILQAKR